MLSLDLLRIFVDASPDAVTFVDPDGKIKLFNRSAEQLTGYSFEDVEGMSIVAFYSRKRDFFKITSALQKYDKCWNLETEILHKSGMRIPIAISVSKVFDDRHRFVGTLGISRDLRQQKHMEKQVLRLERLASSAALASEIAHHINNPLEIIKNYIFLVKKHNLAEDVATYIDTMERELKRVSRMVGKLAGMDFSIEFDLESLDIPDFINEFKFLVEKWLGTNLVHLKTIIHEPLLPLTISRIHLRQVFLHVLWICRDFIGREGVVELEAMQSERKTVFCFRVGGEHVQAARSSDLKGSLFFKNDLEMSISSSMGFIREMNGSITFDTLHDNRLEIRISFDTDQAKDDEVNNDKKFSHPDHR